MSTWGTIEDSVVAALRELNGSEILLATVKAVTARDRKLLIAAIGRELLPAAYVQLTGRDASRAGAAGGLEMRILLAVRSERSEHEARRGSPEASGAFTLAELVADRLRDLIIGGSLRVEPGGETYLGGDEGTVLCEQRYSLTRTAGEAVATFGDVPLAGSDSRVTVEPGPLRRAASPFAFPGIDGVFQRFLGLRGRVITWRGELRAGSDGGLDAIETNIEAELRLGIARTLSDAAGRTFEECVLASFQRHGPRRYDALTNRPIQEFEITFEQLCA